VDTIESPSVARNLGIPSQRKARSPYEDFVSTGPDTLNGRYLRQFWHPVYRADRLAPDRAKPIRILSEDFTLYRGSGGTPHVVAQRCPHRGTQLSVGFVEDDCIRCLYHGWKFDAGGQCVEQPAELSEFASKVRIRSCPTREYLGLIFAYFGEGEPPPFPHLPPFEGDGIIENNDNYVHCNYFQAWENDWDEYHTAWTHRTGGVHLAPVLADETFSETDYGVVKHSRKQDGTTRVAAFILPATVRLTIPSPTYYRYRNVGPLLREAYLIHTPIDDEHQWVFQAQHVDVPQAEREAYMEHHREFHARLDANPADAVAKEILAGRKTLAEVKANDEFPAMARLEDQCAQPGQGAIADRGAEWLGRSDKGIIQLRKIWARELQALAETGRSKEWSVMERMPA
jgi:5,5'-dehydrodivanillate O-demethylase